MKKLKTVLAQAGAGWFGGALVAALLAFLGVVPGAAGAEANLTTAEISEKMKVVVSELGKIPAAAGEVANKVQQQQSEADSHFTQSTNAALSFQERNRHYALALGSLANAMIEADKFAQFKGRIISDVKSRLAEIQGSVDGLSPDKLPAIDFPRMAAQNRQADSSLAGLMDGESVPQELADDLLMAKSAVSDVEGLSNDSLSKFQGNLKELWHQVVSEEFKVAQSTVVDRRVLTWIQIKAMQGQLGLARNGGSAVSVNAKDVGNYSKTLIKFSAPRETGNGSVAADSNSRRVAATTALLQQ